MTDPPKNAAAKPAAHGVVVGRFHPPHEGHHFLIDSAARSSQQLSVLVLHDPGDTIPVATRCRWIRSAHAASSHVRVLAAPRDEDVSDLVARAQHERGIAVDAVFDPGPRGPAVARAARAPLVDFGGSLEPWTISSSALRNDPAAHWEQVRPDVRGWVARRVVVLGAESTGTTTLVEALVAALRRRGGSYGLTTSVPEFGREMSWIKLNEVRAQRALVGATPPTMHDLVWTDDDFVAIVREQNRIEDAAACRGGPVVICDTDSWASLIWQERYLQRATGEVGVYAQHEPRLLYILTTHDGVAFEADDVRDGEHLRAAMTDRFREALAAQAVPWIELTTADPAQRLEQSLAAIDELGRGPWRWSVTQ